MSEELFARLDERLKNFVDRYEADREATTDRYRIERDERNTWRIGIEQKIGSLESQIQPVVNDHRIIMKLGKWTVGVSALIAAVLKTWDVFIERVR